MVKNVNFKFRIDEKVALKIVKCSHNDMEMRLS